MGRPTDLSIGSDRMVMQAAADFLVGGSNPGAANMAAPPPLASTDQDLNRRPKNLHLGALPFDRSWVCHKCASPLLGAFSAKTFDPSPAPPPPPRKSGI